MRLITVQPGADVSTIDVYNGLVPALQALGAECIPYALNERIDNEGAWFHYTWRRKRKTDPTLQRPTAADIIYKASAGILERALRFQPDWVLIFSGMYLHPDVMVMLRRAGIRTAIILSESPYDATAEEKILPFVNLAWTNERTCVEPYRRINPNTHYLPHAFDPARHHPGIDAGINAAAHDVVFVGTGFQERIDTLSAVDWTGIDLGLYGAWDLLPSRHKLRQFIRGGYVSNDEAAALYRRAKIGLNLYRTSIGFGRDAPRIEYAESLNPRALELAACGVFQISDHRAEVGMTFRSCVPTFDSPGRLEELVRFHLDRPGMRGIRADAARRLAQPHTFAARAEQVMRQLSASITIAA